MSVRTAPCDWPISYAECDTAEPGGLPEPLASMPASGVEAFEGMAAEYLWRWTGKSLGLCEVTIRPCRQDCEEGVSTFWGSGPVPGPMGPRASWGPVLVDGLWYNVGCGRCGDQCGCGGAAPLRIPGPVEGVSSVLEGDVTLDPTTYHVENNTLLVRTDGGHWNPCALEITYTRGVAVPYGGQVAAGVLAVELAKAACGDKDCQLPKRVQTVTRQGVMIAMLDAFDDVDKGHTGIWIIDSWLSSMTRAPVRSKVLSPDLPRHSPRRTTWTAP